MNEVVLGVSDFVALVNQTFEYAYPFVVIVGELANYKVSKNKWVYFDLKDEFASVRFFGTVYTLPGPLEDGMVLEVRGNPRLHPQFGFSVNVQSIRPVGEGSIKKAATLLEAKLRAEGLFDEDRKRSLPYPPQTIGLVTSRESAAYADFMKVLTHRWRGMGVELIDVQVQGEQAARQIVSAIEQFNQAAAHPDVLILIRGGGSADDLQAFSTEQVTRAVAASRIPTCVAIGHETDTSLAELAADWRASTPSNAAELLVPDRLEVLRQLHERGNSFGVQMEALLAYRREELQETKVHVSQLVDSRFELAHQYAARQKQLVTALSPEIALRRGYAIIRDEHNALVRSGTQLATGAIVNLQVFDATATAEVKNIQTKE